MLKDKIIILNVSKGKESDLGIQVLSRKTGLKYYYIRQGKKGYSQRASKIEPMGIYSISASSKSSYINEINLVSRFAVLKNQETAFAEAFFIAELLREMSNGLIESESEKLFDFMETLSTWEVLENSYVRKFTVMIAVNLLNLHGFISDLTIDAATSGKLDISKPVYAHDIAISFTNQNDKSKLPISPAAVKTIKLISDGVSIETILKLKLTNGVLGEILRTVILWSQLILEKELKSAATLNIFL